MKFNIINITLALSIILAPTSALPITVPNKEAVKTQMIKMGKAVKTHGITAGKNTLRFLLALGLAGSAFYVGGFGLGAGEKLLLNTKESNFTAPRFTKDDPEYDLLKTINSKVLAAFIGIVGLLAIQGATGQLTLDQEEAEAIYPITPGSKKASDEPAAVDCAAPSGGCCCC